ncbi:rRNA biogenesis protein rrp5 [Aquibacillus salsiterrae]|uniref:rRNA biogenesis protein rrp5 n=1 Tax=Aquibacillus salsiterrae TaxID=2950439 RepID=A0A9X3WCU5_9BACI|nr:rRNA biogenesis protein rrp5 [Aquibacillus salsiterrae]MDC3416593.1 rRNA biogenesis protein rrp5 [Aquibacillus salsiterrae]
MSKTKLALDVVQDLRDLAGSMEALISAMEGAAPENVGTPQEIEPKEKAKPKKTKQVAKTELPTLEDVRGKLAALSQEGKQAQVKELITSFGAKKLSDIPTNQFPEVLQQAEKLS